MLRKIKVVKHKYFIDAKQLGDDTELPWTNLGFWDNTQNYPQACRQLADQLALATHLNSKDHLLDLGCGQGASLLHWLEHYQPKSLTAVELQPECFAKINQHITKLDHIYCQSFLNLNLLPFKRKFDVVLCIDAAYHSVLNSFLASVSTVLNSNARLGFHYLIRSDRCQNMSALQQQKYRYLLKAADVSWGEVPDKAQLMATLQQQGFENIQIQDISTSVLQGFAHYIQQQKTSDTTHSKLDRFKIQMTAKLCQKLYQEGYVRYVQVVATKQ